MPLTQNPLIRVYLISAVGGFIFLDDIPEGFDVWLTTTVGAQPGIIYSSKQQALTDAAFLYGIAVPATNIPPMGPFNGLRGIGILGTAGAITGVAVLANKR